MAGPEYEIFEEHKGLPKVVQKGQSVVCPDYSRMLFNQ